ncbi:MAG: hypothetical protein KAT57_07300 [Candidatus Lokiarchaeota archaeon]|nr:hypothetical protein [Candidatus Lokiarchaeota archaeon]
MPDGLIIMKYDERSGIDIMAKYPEEKLKISNKTLMHILNLHEFSKQPGIASLTIQNINFVTYYSGSETDFFFILMLNMLEDPEDFENVLEDVSQIVLENIGKNKIIEMLPSLFKRIVEHPKNNKNS